MLHAALVELPDPQLAGIAGQALFVSDKIYANELPNNGGPGSATDYTFYRVGLDIALDLNLNIDKMKLGCGGANDLLDSSVCDIDMDYVRFMGRCTTAGCGQTSPDGKLIPGSGTAVSSDFRLTRPYLELAIRNDGTRTAREVVGIKIGAQKADGFFGVGQVLARGNNPANHVGINAISGSLGIELSATIPVTLHSWTTQTSSDACIGYINCGGAGWGSSYYLDPNRTIGTRMKQLQAGGIPLRFDGGLASYLGDGYANFIEDLRFVHGFELRDTSDFFMSFQRAQVSYPKYDRSAYMTNRNGTRIAANSGWWMNVPDVKMLNIAGPHQDLSCGFLYTACLGAFSSPGVVMKNLELNSSPPDNCFGATQFC